MIATDRHVSIQKTLHEKYLNINYQFWRHSKLKTVKLYPIGLHRLRILFGDVQKLVKKTAVS